MMYIYNGPLSGVTLKDGEKAKEVMLFPGKEIDLPETNEYVKRLVAQGYLKPVEVKKKKKKKGGK